LIENIVSYIPTKFERKIFICKVIMFFKKKSAIFVGLMGETSASGKNGRKKLK
jgi:hypothetical protein